MKQKWDSSPINDGFVSLELSSWGEFSRFVNEAMLPYKEYVWRGQRRADWKLEPTLDRVLRKLKKEGDSKFAEDHLSRFKYASRGRRSDLKIALDGNDNDWWAVGQHHGLATPLLDWTRSPYTAAYFAFEEEDYDDNETRAIWAFDQEGVEEVVAKMVNSSSEKLTDFNLEFIEPMTLDTPRMINQAALFSRTSYSMDIEAWSKKIFENDGQYWRLIKVTCPSKERNECLRAMNRMNICHLSLFPDLDGASRYCNMHLGIEKY